jgi:hypothetical protein
MFQSLQDATHQKCFQQKQLLAVLPGLFGELRPEHGCVSINNFLKVWIGGARLCVTSKRFPQQYVTERRTALQKTVTDRLPKTPKPLIQIRIHHIIKFIFFLFLAV